MVHIPEYSLVIRPPDPVIELVGNLKKRLREHIGWFGSAHAQAHLTIFNFDANADELLIWQENIGKFCQSMVAQEVAFDHFDAFAPRTFFVSPDDRSMLYLNNVITSFARFIGEKPQAHAHISIARSLREGQLEQVQSLLNEPIHFTFLCNSLTLRRFNAEVKQYSDIVARFAFGG